MNLYTHQLEDVNVRYLIKGARAYFATPYNPYSDVQNTYPFITPAAVVGLVERVYWKPEYQVVVNSISVCSPIEYIVVDNELPSKGLVGKRVWKPLISRKIEATEAAFNLSKTDDLKSKSRIQILKDVAYICDVTYKNTMVSNKVPSQHISAIEYRCRNKKYFEVPTLGCPSFVADVSIATGFETPCPINMEILEMTYYHDYKEKDTRVFFDAICVDGVISVPSND